MTSISERIRLLRKSEHLTQKNFAKRLLISQSYLSGLENGNEAPTSKLLKLICLEFGVNEAWLLNAAGEMYTEVYENDKSALTEVSNEALLKIMTLLSTKSNVEYGFYANSLGIFSNMLGYAHLLGEDKKLNYLELLETLIMDLDRMIYVSFNNANAPKVTSNHKKGILDDLEALISFSMESEILS